VRAAPRVLMSLAAGLIATALAAEAAPPGRPTRRETADQVLIGEKPSWDRHLHGWLRLPDWLDVGIEHRTRLEVMTEPWRPGEEDTNQQLPQRTRLRIGVDPLPWARFLVEFEDARTHFDGQREFTGNTIDETDVLQLLATVGTRDLLGSGLRGDLHVGRLTMDFGSRRLVARNRYRNTTNSFEGVHLRLASGDAWRARAFVVRPVERREVQRNKRLSEQLFWGSAFESDALPWLRAEIYYFGLDDDDARRDLHTFGARARREPAKRVFDYQIEAIGQLGRVQGRDRRAGSGHAQMGYTLALPWAPRPVARLDYASGSDDPGGTDHSFDPLYGARRFDFGPTGIFGAFRRANLVSAGAELSLAPRADLKLRVTVRHWMLAQGRDAFSGSGLRDPSGDSGRALGQDLELAAQWSPRPWVAVEAVYDRWWKGSYLDRVPGAGSGNDSDYFALSTILRF
jgi:hypothetical protein